MSTLTWVLAGAMLFWMIAAALKMRDVLPESVGLYGPLITLHTKRGRTLLDRLARPKRAWRAWGNFGLGAALVVMVGSLAALVFIAVATLVRPPQQSTITQPRNALIIPGYNEFLPPSVAPEILAGLVIGLVVHEGGHGILCRVENIDIDSLGLVFLTLIPAGAFVQPSEESQRRASRGAQARMFAAGVTNNFAITALAFALLFGPVVGSMGVVTGATVAGALPGSPAAAADVGRGDVIVGVDGQPVDSNAGLDAVLGNTTERTVTVELRSGESVEVRRSVLVTGAVQGGPTGVDRETTIDAVNGTPVNTTAEFYDALADRPVATLSMPNATVTAPMGAYVTVQRDEPLHGAGAPTSGLVITHVDGERVVTDADLQRALDGTTPGETLTVRAYPGSEGPQEYDVTLGEHPREDTGYLGVMIYPGTSGLTVSDFGVEPYPAGRYLSALGGSCERCPDLDIGFAERVWLSLQFPIVGVAGSTAFPFNFAGFTGGIAEFYTVSGPLGLLGGAAFVLANLLFWTGWLNLNLGFFNCVPTFMLDGGHILRTSVEAVVARLPVDGGRRIVTAATLSVQLVMLGSLLLMLFGAQLLG